MLSFRLDSFVYVCQSDDLTALQSIPAMQRRRLSPLAKMALHTACTAIGQGVDYIVWSSVCGDESTTASIMMDIAQGQTPSPTQFSVSVHNAIAGLYSILYQDNTVATSLSSPATTMWSDALLEAYAFLIGTNKKRALIVCYDMPLPAGYQSSYQSDELYALACVLSLGEPNCTISPNQMADCTKGVQLSPKQFYDFWCGDNKQIMDSCWIYKK